MIVSCWSYLGWILLNSEDTINSGLFISVGSMFDDKEEELYKMYCRGLYPTLSLKFISSQEVVKLTNSPFMERPRVISIYSSLIGYMH